MSNEKQFYNLLAQIDPDLYLIKMVLDETQVNPALLPKIIRSLANLAYGTGFGKIQIIMQDGVVTHIRPEENDLVRLDTLLER